MPYPFDLYVSVQKNANIKNIKNKFKKITMLNYIEIQESENRGRDFGPMFVLFGKKLKKYDYIMHIHSKKSLRTGEEQVDWRRYLLDYLLGSSEIIMKCFYLMENKNIGLIYPDTHKSIPPWANNWLNEKKLAKQVMSRLGLKFEDNYLEFSAGSMFWANKKAIEPLLDLNLTWEDFGGEKEENGETLEYVFERMFGIVVQKREYDIAIYNEDSQQFLLNKGKKNLDIYFSQTVKSTIDFLRNFNIISFNIFDTLIARKIYNPDDIFILIEGRLKNININIENFASKRKIAENTVRAKKNFEGDCSINEIYNEIVLMGNISKEEADIIKELEIQTELELCTPRKDIQEIYNTLLKEGKKIILTIDMYLTRDILDKILNNCGYYNYSDILISSELGVRKDDGTMWEYVHNKYKNTSIVHVGDDEQSDIHRLIETQYIMKGRKLFNISNYCINKEFNIYESVIMGCIINKSIFNSPFVFNNYKNESLIKTNFNFGYSILGPLVLKYFIWLINSLKESDKVEVLLFTSRKGYYLQKIYNHIVEKINNKKMNNIEQHYLYISRRAISVANIENTNDIYGILEKNYTGSLKALLYYRLGFKENTFEDRLVELPRDFEIVKRIVDENLEKILQNAKHERENYKKYIERTIVDRKNKNLNFINIGFSGTVQYYLSLLLNQKISGKYFAVSNTLKLLDLGCKVDSCYNESILDSKEINNNPLLRYHMILESFFTAPHGQLKYINDNCNPVLLVNKNTNKINQLEEIYSGIIDFIDDVCGIFKEDILDIKIDKKLLLHNYKCFLREANLSNERMKRVFDVEDFYCSNSIVNALDLIDVTQLFDNENKKKNNC